MRTYSCWHRFFPRRLLPRHRRLHRRPRPCPLRRRHHPHATKPTGITGSGAPATDWSNPALWSAGVPNDDAVNKYVVNLQNNNTFLNALATR